MLLRYIRYFLAVAEQGNFTRAAETLHISQPTLSQQIKQLEDLLHIQLFDRSGRTVQLTDAGIAWMSYARRAIQDLEAGTRAIHDVEDLQRGSLRLAMTPTFTSYLTGSVVGDFYRRYPGIRLDLREMTQDEIETLLVGDQLDLGIAFDPIHSPDVSATPLFTETLNLMVGGQHPLANRQEKLSPDEFSRLPLVLLNGDFSTRRFINRFFQSLSIRPRVAIESDTISAIVQMVRLGQLATILPQDIANIDQWLSPVSLQTPKIERQAVLLQRKDAYRSAAARAFIALLTDYSTAKLRQIR
ncbi:transcriptional regulator CynR [Rouxiella sp. Mn2063]|uniref:transcriptional regulator CynR n=1 Tax=Rouxiella sp. Mn2063 TaxID=3395262 RepID=UPI003BCC1037